MCMKFLHIYYLVSSLLPSFVLSILVCFFDCSFVCFGVWVFFLSVLIFYSGRGVVLLVILSMIKTELNYLGPKAPSTTIPHGYK